MSLQWPNQPSESQLWKNRGLSKSIIAFTLVPFPAFIKDISPCNLFHAGGWSLIFINYEPKNSCL